MMRKCGVYVRVSTEMQAYEGESLDEQEQRLRDFCKQRNWGIVKVYQEEGKCGFFRSVIIQKNPLLRGGFPLQKLPLLDDFRNFCLSPEASVRLSNPILKELLAA